MIVAIVHDRVTDASTPDEADVLAQAEAVSDALKALGHEPVTIEFSLNLEAVAAELRRSRAELVFNLVEAVGARADSSTSLRHSLRASASPSPVPGRARCSRRPAS